MQFIPSRKKSYLVSGILVLLSAMVVFLMPKNLGIDMTGGVQITYRAGETVTSEFLVGVGETITSFEQSGEFIDVVTYPIEGSELFRVEVGIDPSLNVAQSDVLSESFRVYMSEALPGLQESAYVKIGNSLGSYVRQTAGFTIIVSLVLIALYLTYAFRGALSGWSNLTFGIVTLVTLLHDVCIATGVYIALGSIFGSLQIDTFFVTALLTILGYSINDTIVVLDRIRVGLRKKQDEKSKKKLFASAIASSVRRSLFTSLTLLMVLMVLLLVGPTQLLGFVTLLVLGTIVGTYSSLFIAAPLVYDIEQYFSSRKKGQ